MARVLIRPRARRDVQAILTYYLEVADPAVADRFRLAASTTFAQLAETPRIGSPRKVNKPEFRDVRMWHVQGFDSYLIFYFPRRDGVAIDRVIHASLDYQRVFS